MSHTDLECRCVTKHKPVNTEPDLHHIHPLSWNGPDTKANIVAVCPSQHRLIHQLLREYRRAGGRPGWEIRKHFSAFTRALAADGWARYEAGR